MLRQALFGQPPFSPYGGGGGIVVFVV